MKRNLQLTSMIWANVTAGIIESFATTESELALTDKQSTWISRSLPEVYKKVLTRIDKEAKTKISNSNIAGAVYISSMRGEYVDITEWTRNISSYNTPENNEETDPKTRTILKEIRYYNNRCKKKMEILDNILLSFVQLYLNILKLEHVHTDDEVRKKGELKQILKKEEVKLNKIYKSASKDLKNKIYDVYYSDAKIEKEKSKFVHQIAVDDIVSAKRNLRIFCCTLKAIVCRKTIRKIWIQQLSDSLDCIKASIGDNIIDGRFFLAKDSDTDNYYYAYEPLSNITVEVKIKKSYIRK